MKKKNGQIHVCMTFQDHNNAYLKDDFSLPIIEIMVDATTSHERLTFMMVHLAIIKFGWYSQMRRRQPFEL